MILSITANGNCAGCGVRAGDNVGAAAGSCAAVIESGAAVGQCERHAVKGGIGEIHVRGRNLQADPLAGRGDKNTPTV